MAAPRWLIVVMVLALREIMVGIVLRGWLRQRIFVRGREPDVVGSTGRSLERVVDLDPLP